jgi:hypothetical protein
MEVSSGSAYAVSKENVSMPNPLTPLGTVFGGYLPTLLAAILVLIIGWIIALIVSRVIGGLLRRSTMDDRLTHLLRTEQGTQTSAPRVTHWIQTIVFWVIMLFAIVAFLQVLNLALVSTPLNNVLAQVFGFIPALLSAAALLFVAWLIATILRMVIVRVLASSSLSRRLSENADVHETNRAALGQTIGNIVYWLVFLLFLPAILGALNLNGILAPVQSMVNEILTILPNILAAVLILAIGYFAARIIRQIVTGLLQSVGVDRIGSRAGVPEAETTPRLSNVIGMVVFVLVIIPVVIAALNALNIPAVSTPAAAMLTTLLNAIPVIFGAVLLVAIAYFVARILGQFVASILEGFGFNRLFGAMGLPNVMPAEPASVPTTGAQVFGRQERRPEQRTWTPSRIVGTLVTIAVILFAVIAAANLLGFGIVALMVSQFLVLAGNILLGLVIFGLGLYLSSLADRAIRGSSINQADILAVAARVSILIFAGALALRQMGLGQDIVNLAFGLLFGAVAVAAALAFGLGGRDVAARQLETWRHNLEREQSGHNGSRTFRSIPATGEPQGGNPETGNQTGTGHNPATGSSDMLYEGGENQASMTGDIPDTGSSSPDIPPGERPRTPGSEDLNDGIDI